MTPLHAVPTAVHTPAPILLTHGLDTHESRSPHDPLQAVPTAVRPPALPRMTTHGIIYLRDKVAARDPVVPAAGDTERQAANAVAERGRGELVGVLWDLVTIVGKVPESGIRPW